MKKPTAPKGKLLDLPLSDLLFADEFNPRAGTMNQELVDDMIHTLRQKPNGLPPIRVCIVDTHGKVVTDGRKRTEAHRLAGRKTIRALVFDKTSYIDALADAAAANVNQTAEPRTAADKRQAVANLMKGHRLAGVNWSDKQYMAHCRVSNTLVASVRAEQGSETDGDDRLNDAKRLGSDGKLYSPPHRAPESTPHSYAAVPLNPDADDPAEKTPEPAKPKPGAEKSVPWRDLEAVWRCLAQLPDHIHRCHANQLPSEEVAGFKRTCDSLHRIVSGWQKKLSRKS